jgi:PadR family transcriptional regulator, regulatory protein PadR
MIAASQAPRTSQLLHGVLDICLLAVVADAPAYGYEMTTRLKERGLGVVRLGSIYPAVARLEGAGLLEAYQQTGNSGPPRKYYRLTDAGALALSEWRKEWVAARSAVDGVLGTSEGAVRR